MGNSIQVGPRQYSTIYQIFRECPIWTFPEPALFVSQNPLANSYALGQEHPYVVINTGILDLLNVAEIQAVLAMNWAYQMRSYHLNPNGDVGYERLRSD